MTLSSLNLLVIDDDEGMRHLLFELLAPLGHQVVLAGSAEEGLALLPFTTFHVAFLDHNLPGIEGFVLGEYLRKNNPDMQIALVTGDTTPRLRRLCEQEDLRFIAKPFEREDLVELVRAAERRAGLSTEEEVTSPARAPLIGPFLTTLDEVFQLPKTPQRLQDQLAWHVQESLSKMRMHGPNEQERTVAFSALLAARVLGCRLPKTSQGKSPYEAYDELMDAWGAPPAFREPTGD